MRHGFAMDSKEQPGVAALAAAEEILRRIYGDDFLGCTVTLQEIAAIADKIFRQQTTQNKELLELYEKVVEAVDLLSTPPKSEQLAGSGDLGSLLTERLDAIHALTRKTIQTTDLVKVQRKLEEGAE